MSALYRRYVSAGLLGAATAFSSLSANAQQPGPFFDQRRLPDVEERRNQEARQEQQRQQDADARLDADQKRLAAEAEASKKAEEQRIAAEAEARKNAEEQRIAAEAEARKKAEEQRIAAEAEARKKAEEQRIAAEAEARKKAEEQRIAAEAEARKKAEEQRIAAEAEAKKNAEEQRIAAEAKRKADTDAAALQTAAINKSVGDSPAATCNDRPKVSSRPLPAGRLELSIESACRRGQTVSVTYGEQVQSFVLDATSGKATLVLDLYLGRDQDFVLGTADGKQVGISGVPPPDASSYSKVALIWSKAVDLDLHALENAAAPGSADAVHARAPRTAEDAKARAQSSGRGAGFMSTVANGTSVGTQVEVYTFIHSPDQMSGAMAFALEHVSRGTVANGDYCGQGPLAQVPYEVILLKGSGEILRDNGIVPSVPCGNTLEGGTLHLRAAIPDLKFRR